MAAPDLLGGPPEQPATVERKFTAMAPIANPESMTEQERHRVYGERYDHPTRHARHRPGSRHAAAPRHNAVHKPSVAAQAIQRQEPRPAAAPTVIPPQTAVPSTPAFQLAQPNLDWLSVPGRPFVRVPGLGRVATKYLTAAGLLALALVLLAIAASTGHDAGRRRRVARTAVGAGPAFADAPRFDRGPPWAEPGVGAVAPFPYRSGETSEQTVREREHEPA